MVTTVFAEQKKMTADEYLEMERNGIREIDGKYEFFNNQLKPMAGATPNHNSIHKNILYTLEAQIRGKDDLFDLYHSDIRVKSFLTHKDYFYPDVIIVKGKPYFDDENNDNLANPKVIIEVGPPPHLAGRAEAHLLATTHVDAGVVPVGPRVHRHRAFAHAGGRRVLVARGRGRGRAPGAAVVDLDAPHLVTVVGARTGLAVALLLELDPIAAHPHQRAFHPAAVAQHERIGRSHRSRHGQHPHRRAQTPRSWHRSPPAPEFGQESVERQAPLRSRRRAPAP